MRRRENQSQTRVPEDEAFRILLSGESRVIGGAEAVGEAGDGEAIRGPCRRIRVAGFSMGSGSESSGVSTMEGGVFVSRMSERHLSNTLAQTQLSGL